MQVEKADRLGLSEVEAVHSVGRRGDEGAGSGDARVVVDAELDLALEHVEAVGVVGVGVRVDALEAGLEGGVWTSVVLS